jgi:hypothetical protein
MRAFPPACLLALGLAACSTQGRGDLAGGVDSTPVGATDAPTARSGAAATLALPAEARVRGRLDERRYANGWRQSVALDRAVMGGGWNELTIDIRTAAAEDREGEIPMGKPTEDGLRRELSDRFPATEMRVVAEPMRNALGPFGLATGAGPAGTRCAFAWQWVDDLRAVVGAKAGRSDEIPASIRLRVCREGLTPTQVADWYSRLRTGEAIDVERVVEAARSGVDAPAPAVRKTAAKIMKTKPARRLREATTEVRRQNAPRAYEPPRPARFVPSLPPQAYAGPSVMEAARRPTP